MPKSFSIKTFGCKLNQYESGRVADELILRGYTRKEFGEAVDFTVINTCSVTDNSEKKCRSSIRAAAKDSMVVVAGCMAGSSREQIEKICPSAVIISNSDKKDYAKFCDSITCRAEIDSEDMNPADAVQLIQTEERSRAFLKIQDGCDGTCSYCIVPSVRGLPSSRPSGEIISEVNSLLDRGFHEIVLTGVTIGKYFSDGLDFSGLLEKIIAVDRSFRIRVTSIEPKHVDTRMIDLFSSPKICPHIHLPLQSGSDAVLAAMNRPYSSKEFLSVVDKITKAHEEIAVGTDVIIGFPTETGSDFKETLSVVSEARFAYVHQFRFSPRRGTPASSMKQASRGDEISSRLTELKSLGEELSFDYRKRFINRILPCVAHSGKDGVTAVSGNYITIKLDASDSGSAETNGLIGVRLLSAGRINTGIAVEETI